MIITDGVKHQESFFPLLSALFLLEEIVALNVSRFHIATPHTVAVFLFCFFNVLSIFCFVFSM